MGVQAGSLLAGGATASAEIYSPDFPPLSPHAKDDEFNGVALDGSWEIIDPVGRVTVSVANGQCAIIHAAGSTPGNRKFGGIAKSVSGLGSAYTIWAKIGLVMRETTISDSNFQIGLFVGNNGDPTLLGASGMKSRTVGRSIDRGGTNRRQMLVWDDYEAISAAVADVNPAETAQSLGNTSCYARLSVNGTLWNAALSTDGISWRDFGRTADTLGLTVARIGVMVMNDSNNADASPVGDLKAYVDWFRVTEGTPTVFDTTPSSKRGVI